MHKLLKDGGSRNRPGPLPPTHNPSILPASTFPLSPYYFYAFRRRSHKRPIPFGSRDFSEHSPSLSPKLASFLLSCIMPGTQQNDNSASLLRATIGEYYNASRNLLISLIPQTEYQKIYLFEYHQRSRMVLVGWPANGRSTPSHLCSRSSQSQPKSEAQHLMVMCTKCANVSQLINTCQTHQNHDDEIAMQSFHCCLTPAAISRCTPPSARKEPIVNQNISCTGHCCQSSHCANQVRAKNKRIDHNPIAEHVYL